MCVSVDDMKEMNRIFYLVCDGTGEDRVEKQNLFDAAVMR